MTELDKLPKGLGFVQQYYRMLRWYYRFEKINKGKPVSIGQALNDFDEILAFFLVCYHLSDWIIEDVLVEKNHPDRKKFQKLEQEVRDFIRNNDCLKLCADICNSAKHRTLHKRNHYPENTELHDNNIEIIETEKGPMIKQKWEIVTESNKRFDLFEIATDCKKKWFEFLQTHETQIRELTPYWTEEQDTVSFDPKMVKGNVIESSHITVHRVQHKDRVRRSGF
jgi:hypothetical protein